MPPPLIHIIRHGEGIHNVQRNYAHPDPSLTKRGQGATKAIHLPFTPDLILISPMTRTIQTAMNIFPWMQDPQPNTVSSSIPVQIWPDLREAHDALCNRGVSRADLHAQFPSLDLAECSQDWDYPAHSVERATARAERVRSRLHELTSTYNNIVVITHRGFAAYLVKGVRFGLCERRAYRFAMQHEAEDEGCRMGVHCETEERLDFGPTVLVRVG